MAVIETKFGLGDFVWHATTAIKKCRHPCPDCKGSGKWEAKSPAGGVFSFACPRCSASYHGKHELSLDYAQWAPFARCLTVGQVRAYSGPDGKNEYMCLETGVGSGSLYCEDRLFATEAEALACAEAIATVENANQGGWVAKQYAASLRVCDYELKDAAMEAAISAAKRSQWRVGYLVDDLENAYDLAEVKRVIADWRENPPEPDDLSGSAATDAAQVDGEGSRENHQ